MADHVRTLRKRLERMERAGAQNTGRPVNQRDKALADALREAIRVMSSPRITNAVIHVGDKEIRGNLDFAENVRGVEEPCAWMTRLEDCIGYRLSPEFQKYLDKTRPIVEGENGWGTRAAGKSPALEAPYGGVVLQGRSEPRELVRRFMEKFEELDGRVEGSGLTDDVVLACIVYAANGRETSDDPYKRVPLASLPVVQGMVINAPQIDAAFIRQFDAEVWRESMGRKAMTQRESDEIEELKARVLHKMILEAVGKETEKLRSHPLPPLMPAFTDYTFDNEANAPVEIGTPLIDPDYGNVYYGHYVTFGDGLTTHGYDIGDDAGIVYEPEHVGYQNPAEVLRDVAVQIGEETGLGVDHDSFDAAAEALNEPLTEHNMGIIRAWQDGKTIECRHIASTRWAKADPFVYGFDWENFEYRIGGAS